jgi:serine/threonine-protein kinase
MSPEQVQAQPADQRSDIYSLGCTFYEMVTGRRPIDGSSEYAILNAHLKQLPQPPATLNSSVPVVLSGAIMKAVAKQPTDRFQSAAEFREALRVVEGYTMVHTTTTALPGRTATYAGRDLAHAQIEAALMKSVGPIAKILMARISPQCSSVTELRDRLAAQITDPIERSTFLKQANIEATTPGGSTPPGGRDVAEITQWDPVVLANAKRHLALYAGPIASVIVDRASKKARTPQELYGVLANEISSPADRAAFLKLTPFGR